MNEIFDRVVQTAEGAALGTDTEMEFEVIHGIYNVLPNISLQEAIYSNLTRVGGVEYSTEERQFAETLRSALPPNAPPVEAAAIIRHRILY